MKRVARVWRGAAAALVMSACIPGADPEQGAEPPREPAARPASAICGRLDQPLGYHVHVREQDFLADGSTLDLELVNENDVGALINVDVTWIGGTGIHAHREIEQKLVAAGERAQLQIPVDALGLPMGQEPAPGMLQVTSRAFFDDGEMVGHGAPMLHFQRSGAGWVLARSEEELLSMVEIPQAAVLASHGFDTDQFGTAVDDGREGVTLDVATASEPAQQKEPAPPPGVLERLETVLANQEPLTFGPGSDALVDKAAVTVDFCLKQTTTYTDAGFGEDNWTSNTATLRDTIGQFVAIHAWICLPDGSNCRWLFKTSTYLGDGYVAGKARGCTGPLALNTGMHQITVHSIGIVNGNHIWASPSESFDEASTRSFTHDLTSGGTKNLTFAPIQSSMLNVYMALAQAVRIVGGIDKDTSETNWLRVHPTTGGSWFEAPRRINISTARFQTKHEITHELGHYIQYRATDSGLASDYSDTGDGDCSSGAGDHDFDTREWISSAFSEGYASFYGSIAWNDTAETDCITTRGFDCEGSATLATRFMETQCTPPFSSGDRFRQHGNEHDWQRAFWDVLTDGTEHPSHNDMLRWMKAADDSTAWSRSNSYSLLNAEADARGGVLNTRFDTAKTFNGIDH